MAVVAICLAPFCGFLTADGRVIAGSDYSTAYVPFFSFARDELVAGRTPLWMPYLSGGTPLHAGQQIVLCYPLATPFVLMMGANQGLKVCLLLHLVFAAVGVYRLARDLHISPQAGSIAMALVTLGVFPMGHLGEGHITLVFGYTLLPWFFWVLVRLLRKPGPTTAAALAAFAALFEFGSHPQLLYYALGAGVCWAVGSVAVGSAARHRARFAGWLMAAMAVTIPLAAAQWLPAVELARGAAGVSERGAGRYATMYSMDGADLLRLFVPRLNGDEQAGIEPFERERYQHERGAYLGWISLPLALYGFSRSTVARWQWGFAWLCLAAAQIGLGANSALWELFGASVPGLWWFRCQGRVWAVVSVFAALMAARGLDALVRAEPHGSLQTLGGLAALVLAGAATMFDALRRLAAHVDIESYLSYARHSLPHEFSDLALLVVVSLATLGLARYAGRDYPLVAYGAVLLLLLADLGEYSVRQVRLVPAAQALAPPADNERERFAYLLSDRRANRISLQFSRAVPVAIYARRPAVNTNDGGMLPDAVMRLYSAIERDPGPALALAACRDLFIENEGRWREFEAALPRFRLVCGGAQALCERPIGECGENDLQALRGALSGTVNVRRDAPIQIEVDVNAPENGMFVLADTHYPGWQATVDGKEVPIVAVHGVFRGVRLVAGKHRVLFSYHPWSFTIGCALSACGLVGLAGLVLFAWRERRRRRRAVACTRLAGASG